MNDGQSARRGWRMTSGLVRATALAGSLLIPACADDPPPPVATPAAAAEPAPTPPKPLPPLPRSSIVAVVQHRGQLGLSDEQIDALEKRDQEREQEDQALRAEAEKKRKAAEDAKTASNSAAPNRTPGGMQGGGMRGGGRGGGGRGGPSFGAGAKTPRGESMEDRLDANDTKAYLDIEDVLTPEQREAAREIASDYRAQLYDRREQQKRDAAK